MASGRAAFGIGEFVTGISHLEWQVGDAEACARALAPLGAEVVGRRPAGPGHGRSLALAAGDARIVLTEPADEPGGAAGRGWPEPLVADVALEVTRVSAAQQVAMARGALPPSRERRAARAVDGPAFGGPNGLVHSLVAAGGWLEPFEHLAVDSRGPAARSPAVEGFGRIRLSVPPERAASWERYYGDILGDAHTPHGRAAAAARAGSTLIEVAPATHEQPAIAPVHTVEFTSSEVAVVRVRATEAGAAVRDAQPAGDGLELVDAGVLLGVRLSVAASGASEH